MDIAEIRKKAKKLKADEGDVTEEPTSKTKEPPAPEVSEAPVPEASVPEALEETPVEIETYESNEVEEEDEETLQAIAFMLDTEEYAVEINKIKEVIMTRSLTDVPRSPAGMMGVLSLRGTMVPILNLRSRLGLPPKEDGERIIIVKDDEEFLGLLVDSVKHVVRIPTRNLEPSPTLNAIDEELISAIGRYEGGSFILLDVDKMLEKV